MSILLYDKRVPLIKEIFYMKFAIPSLFKKRWFQVTILIIIILSSFFIWQAKNKAKDGLKTYEVTTKSLEKVVSASGKITAKNQATLRFQTVGQLSWVGVKKGDTVKKWQAIASLNQVELQKELKQELLDYMNTRWDFETTNRDTYKDKVLTDVIQRVKDQSQFDLDRSVLDVEIADIAQKYAVLTSPIDGIVTEATDENPGINVSLTATYYKIVDPTSLRFTAEVEELDIGQVKEGMPTTITLDAFPDQSLTSEVASIEFSSIETTSGSTAYNVQFPLSQESLYRLDMSGDVKIVVQKKENVLTVPVTAVESSGEQKYVTVLKNNKQQKVAIKTGMETDDDYEVLEGLSTGDKVILK
ncbi:hypothetical protein A2160_01425 [Candidatus Beckwithbacteria bacterium RBG_13_42_9]|uniref:YknX-like C-terminal permuted SH3-like domain-containing protein n=1 Tax=Candidatus Beckwithbacteria bacterium RBG_13_42_9 TaxID=1797457 RepID=A0A1F5E932_9BACT|nr:MAG: hypothetical protein A2160_01425 [Candidatus Beckwithbacteria bacterium RBG_13_42_9]